MLSYSHPALLIIDIVFVLNVKALVGPLNQEKALKGIFSVIVKTDCETDGSSAALVTTVTRCHAVRAATELPICQNINPN